MKKLTLSLFLLFIGLSFAQAQNSSFDEELAKKLGADEYGMKKYVIAFLYRGDRVDEYSPEERAELQRAHLSNINRLAEEGKMVLAGPFFGNDELRGLFFFNVESLEEAITLTESDPSIQAGILKMEMKEWYGSAALPLLLEFHSKISKTGI
ncbi:YciI family protein [Algoriphagus sp. CAU 1675]|uniref:YciI family protein n=1 Tax=Algoriphagus sp. CAU 1675 TaxID=3032597 RepID=UPI0023DBA1C7|nr:YciI family protein [Algoriphagus sp. CAU 1675]MDF2157372.1 YciI family protein [Algoriphagus sp. CAU 1675]